MTFTDAQKNSAFRAVKACILSKIRSEVPSMFEGQAESALATHGKDIMDVVNAALNGTVAEYE